MPKIKVEIAEQLPEPIEGTIYTIRSADIITTQVKSYKGIRVTMTDQNNKEATTMLWLREVAGEQSKLGSFIKALGDDTDAWVSKKIRFATWRPSTRRIEVI